MNNRLTIILLAAALLLVSCGTSQSTQAPTPTPNPVNRTTLLVQGWVDAYHALDADKFMSYFAEDALYYDMAMKDFGAFTRDALDRAVHSSFKQEGFKVEISSFFVSTDGRFAALECTYFDLNKFGRQVGMPAVIILEIANGMIIRETDYYDRGPIE